MKEKVKEVCMDQIKNFEKSFEKFATYVLSSIDRLKIEIKELRNEMNMVRNEIGENTEKMRKELEDLKRRMDRVEDELSKVRNEIGENTKELEDLKRRIDRIEDEVFLIRSDRLAKIEIGKRVYQKDRGYIIDLDPIYGPDPTGLNAFDKVLSERI